MASRQDATTMPPAAADSVSAPASASARETSSSSRLLPLLAAVASSQQNTDGADRAPPPPPPLLPPPPALVQLPSSQSSPATAETPTHATLPATTHVHMSTLVAAAAANGQQQRFLAPPTSGCIRATKAQLKVLQKMFAENPMPSGDTHAAIAERIGMTRNTVRNWFQNQRAKLRRLRLEAAANADAKSDTYHVSHHQQTHDPAAVATVAAAERHRFDCSIARGSPGAPVPPSFSRAPFPYESRALHYEQPYAAPHFPAPYPHAHSATSIKFEPFDHPLPDTQHSHSPMRGENFRVASPVSGVRGYGDLRPEFQSYAPSSPEILVLPIPSSTSYYQHKNSLTSGGDSLNYRRHESEIKVELGDRVARPSVMSIDALIG